MITEYKPVTNERLEEILRKSSDYEKISLCLEVAMLRLKMTLVQKAVDEIEWQVRKENNNLFAWKGLDLAKCEGFIGGLGLALFYIRKYVPTLAKVDESSHGVNIYREESNGSKIK